MNSADPAQSWIVWPVMLLTALAGVLIPWLAGGLDMDLRPVLKVILSAGVIVFVLSQWRGIDASATCSALVLAVTLVLAFAWWSIGAMAAPGFLFLFSVPVTASAMLSRGWLEYATAALAIGSVFVVSVLSSQPLAWLIGEALSLPVPGAVLDSSAALPGESSAAVAFDQLVMLAQFSIATIATALIVGGFAGAFRRRRRELLDSQRAHEDSRALAEQLLHDGPSPMAVVAQDSGAILSSNADFESVAGQPASDSRSLVEALDPPYPELLQNALGAGVPQKLVALRCRLRGVPCLIDVELVPGIHDRQHVVRVRFDPTPDSALLAGALDDCDHAIALLGPGASVRFSNAAFRRLFPVAERGAAARDCLDRHFGLPDGWWDIAPGVLAELRLDSGGQRLRAAIRLLGTPSEFALTLIDVRPGPAL